MELQWPLILFTTFTAWSAGLFATQGLCALRGECAKSQMPALITSVVLLAIGGIAVFFHLEHWERIFNGFGHLSSGITQELIAIVVMVVVMVVVFAYLRRTANDPHLPKWLSVVVIAIAIILVVACGHSYMMASRPAWDTIFQILSLIGAFCVMGPATFALIVKLASKDGEVSKTLSLSVVAGSVINLVLSVAYLVSMSSAEYTEFASTYFDPTSPTATMIDTSAISAFSGEALTYSVIVIVAGIVAVIAAFLGHKQQNWKTWSAVVLIAAIAAAICLRIVFYLLGYSVFPFYGA